MTSFAPPATTPRFVEWINDLCDRLIAGFRDTPRKMFVWICAIYGTLWFGVTLSFPSMPFDSYEMFAFGREMQWGYWKHPPLEPWFTEIAYRLTGSLQSHFVLAIASILVTFYFVWRLGREIVGETGAVIAVALNVLCYYFTHPVTMYSHNVGQLPIWAATIFCYRNAVLCGRLLHWILFGIAAAVLMYSKYSGALLLIVLAGHMLLTMQGRARVFTPGPWLAVAICFALLLPNLIWLVQSHFLPFAFAFDRTPVIGFAARVLATVKFIFAQIGFHAGMIILPLIAAMRWIPFQGPPVVVELKPVSLFDRSLVIAAAVLPTLMIATMTFIASVDQRAEIGGSLVALSGLLVIVLLPRRPVLYSARLAVALWAIALVALPIGQVVSVYAKAYRSGAVATSVMPAQQLSEAMGQIWREHTKRPLEIVTGDYVNAGIVALYQKPRPSVFISADNLKSPWISPERLRTSGTLVLWSLSDFSRADELPQPYQAALAGLKPQFGTYVLPLGFGGRQAYGWAVLLPE